MGKTEQADKGIRLPESCLYESVSDQDGRLYSPLHWHDFPELLYFKEGSFRLCVDLEESLIEEECFCFVNQGQVHSVEALSGKGVEYSLPLPLCLLTLPEGDIVQEKLLLPLRKGQLSFQKRVTVSDFGFLELLRLVTRVIQHFRSSAERSESLLVSDRLTLNRLSDQLMFRRELLELLGLLEGYGLLKAQEHSEQEKQVQVIKDSLVYIRENYRNKIYIRDLARLTGLNEQYYIRFFGSVLGVPPLEYINAFRIERAKEMLLCSDARAYEVAEACGFRNMGNFIKIFRAQVGMTPHKFRKETEL